MPLRALKPERSDRDLKRRSTLDPAGLFSKKADRSARGSKSSDQLAAERVAASEDGRRPPSSDLARPPSPPVQRPTPNTRRFSLMRFRHASDPQLSAKAKAYEHATADADAPPVPTVPVDTPAIITTAPTVVEHVGDDQTPRRPRRMQTFTLRRRSFDPSLGDRPALRRSMDKKSSADLKRGPFSFLKNKDMFLDEPGRLSTSSNVPETLAESPHESLHEPAQEGTSTLSLPVPRASDSSRSDASSAGHVSFEHTNKPRLSPAKSSSGRFGFRRNKQRASLFPLPMKITPPEFPDTAPATPRASTSGISLGSPHHSPGAESPPLTAINHARLQDPEYGASTPPIPSPSQLALAAASMNLASPASGLLRTESTKSVRSAHSSPHAPPMRLGLRGRSSTMGSLGGHSDDAPPPTPPYANSGRTSTSTAGRTSLSNLFALGARFRQNSEPHSPRHGSPAHGHLGASGLSSHQNSMSISREALVLPEREEGETPGRYLDRIEENCLGKSDIASYLTKTDDPFMLAVLRSYMRKFAFFGDPIDMAIRKLLMQVELPKETQQIDRVLQGFADRYHECNPGIYINPDKAYFISFSIVILHTDFFNKNNKRKMQRPDYIKNSSCEGVSEDALGCIYDNIVYTPFIHIEDDLDLKTVASRRTKRTAVLKGPMADPAKKASREPLDPYTLIFEGKLDVLRPNIREVMNLDDPYSYLGTAPSLNTRDLYKSFSNYGVIQIVSSRSRPEAFMTQSSQENPLQSSVGIIEIPITKVGILWRKDTKRKKARSPWQEWGAILTRSGLSLFRNASWTKSLMHQHDQHQKHDGASAVIFQPPLQEFKQDHMIPMDGAVALVDNTYKKHKNAFVLFSKAGEEIFLADTDNDLTDWLGLLNYSAAFETLGVRPRGLLGGLYEGQRNRGTSRVESSHSVKSVSTPSGDVTIESGKIDKHTANPMMSARKDLMQTRISESEERLTQSIKQLEARLRDARHLQILAPIQPKTRDTVIHAAGRLAAKLKWARIEIWRMKCHRDILAQELEDETHGGERPGRIERLTSSAHSSQPQLSPQPASKAARISGLARLSSKTSSFTGSHKPPLSPAASSARPGTKSSQNTEPGEEAFKTPPEGSRQSSPTMAPGSLHLPPLSFSPKPSQHRSSFASLGAPSPRLGSREHRPSISTMDDSTVLSDDASDSGSQYTTPPLTDADRVEPRTPDRSNTDGLRAHAESDSDVEQTSPAITGSPGSNAKSRSRRSLHRTLRESRGGHHRRSYKGRDSASTALSDDTIESEGLTREKGSFTVHGKKASVITFGAEWQGSPAEERLKSRKQVQDILEAAGSSSEKEGGAEDHIVSSSGYPTIPIVNEPEDATPEATPRSSPKAVKKQRHVSSQTITPANFHESLTQQPSDEESDMSEIEEEGPSEGNAAKSDLLSHSPIGQEDSSEDEPIRYSTPQPQVVEA